MLAKRSPWLIFAACLLLFAIASTPRYELMADHLFVAVRFAVVIFLSILLVRGKFQATKNQNSLLNRFTRWSHGN